MEYRVNKKTGDKIGVIGIGSSYICESDEKTAIVALEKAYDYGFNYYDMATADARCFPYYGKVFSGDARANILYQIHFGADYNRGTYGWTTNIDRVKKSVDITLNGLKTDYIDYGFIHCLDEDSDWQAYQKNGILDYVLSLKEQGVIKHIGASSHTPKIHNMILDTGLVDMIMFSINAGYDYGKGDYAHGGVDERAKLYQRCEAEGIGISVMKPFSGGQLLDARLSPFKKALTQYQCIKYALDKPGVLTVLPGIKNLNDVELLNGYFNASEEEKDYSAIGTFAPADATGKCVYCNHCQPCPAGIDIAMVNKYYDLALVGDDMAKEHYKNLSKHADDCIQCGHCNSRCPFGTDQMGKMAEIAAYGW